MKQRITKLIEFLVRDKTSMNSPAQGEDGLRDGASLRPERLRGRRGKRAHMRRGDMYRPARAARCAS